METTPSLYDRIGGEPALEQMVDGLYKRVLHDPTLGPFFRNTPMDRQRRMQREFMRVALGAPTAYSGLDLAWAHRKRGITEDHFNRFCQHMVDALADLGVDDSIVQEIVNHMAVYKNDITGEAY